MRRIAPIAALLWVGACQCGGSTEPPPGADGGAPDAAFNAPDSGRGAPDSGSLTDAGTSRDGGGHFDAGESADAGAPADSGAAQDSGVPTDAGAIDSGAGSSDAGPADSGVPDAGPFQVDIFISNTCVVSTSPASVSAPLNSQLMLEFHNLSVDYAADVWSSRTYGYLGLVTAGVWDDPIPHCGGPMPYVEYFDVSIAGGPTDGCPSYRFNISCH
jgi:hypothetical protein